MVFVQKDVVTRWTKIEAAWRMLTLRRESEVCSMELSSTLCQEFLILVCNEMKSGAPQTDFVLRYGGCRNLLSSAHHVPTSDPVSVGSLKKHLCYSLALNVWFGC